MTDSSWAETRREQARLKAEHLEASKAAQSAKAQAFLDQFAAAARRANLPPEPLTVRGINKGHAKTPLRGWYLKVDHSVGVDQEGNFYVLKSFLSLPERLKGVTPEPSAPPLTLGYGGRDGESIDLVDALTKILPTWREPPAA